MEFNPDQLVYWQWGFAHVNATLFFTWILMALMVLLSWVTTRNLTTGPELSVKQNMLEVIVSMIQGQIEESGRREASRFLPFIGTLFLFIALSNTIGVLPGVQPPTGSLSTTAALALCVFAAVPIYGIASQGLRRYLAHYVTPTPLMLPFNLIGEFSRTLALAVRLFGNIMSGTLTVAILMSLAPLFFPVLMQAFGLLIGLIQAYVFALLAMIYIASGTRLREREAAQTAPDQPSSPGKE